MIPKQIAAQRISNDLKMTSIIFIVLKSAVFPAVPIFTCLWLLVSRDKLTSFAGVLPDYYARFHLMQGNMSLFSIPCLKYR